MKNPTMEVKATWPNPVARATGPVVRTSWGSSLSPTRNNSTEIPSLPSRSSSDPISTNPKTAGPTRIPTAMKATTSGWRKTMANTPTTAATASTIATCRNVLSIISGAPWGPGSGGRDPVRPT